MFPCICQTPYTRHSLWVLRYTFLEILNLNQHARRDWQLTPGFYEVGGAHAFLIKCPKMFQIVKLWPHEPMDKTDRQILNNLCTFCKYLIEMMTCATGEARCQEKSYTGKMPCQPNLHLIQQRHTLRSSKLGVPNLVKGLMSGLLQLC